jgi:short-subunit dehydrogenase
VTTALITGGTSGIGASFARQLAARSYDLVLVARDTARLDEAAEELRTSYGIEVEVISADLADRDQLLTVRDRVADPARPIDLLINNAGFGVHARLLDEDTSRHETAFDVMCRAVLILSNAAGRAMRDRDPKPDQHLGIINTSSFAGWITMGSYSAIKSWVTTFTESLAGELHGSGVTVTALCPGWVRTEFHSRAGINASRIPDALWLDSDDLVRQTLADFDRGRVISNPTLRYKALGWLVKHIPRAGVRAVSRKLSSSRHRS